MEPSENCDGTASKENDTMSYNVLIVDDSDVIRAMIARTLDLAQVPVGCVHHASNGREALAVLEQEWIDLVLADINMPVMNGVEMIERMRERPDMADVPVVVVSSEGASERVSALVQHGVTTWVRKPFTPEEIRDAIVGVAAGLVPASTRAAQVDAVFCPILETFAFVYPEPVSLGDLPQPGDDLLTASVTFSGAANGALSISAPCELCIELSANILGTDRDDPDARMRGADALGEIANIAAGHLVSVVEPDLITTLQPPIVSQCDTPAWRRQVESPCARTYVIEELPIVVTLGLRPSGATA
jgi:two-component system chemotaxis response regulator CheY